MPGTELDGATEKPAEGSLPGSAGEFAALWNGRSEDDRERMLLDIIRDRKSAGRCWFQDHDAELNALRRGAVGIGEAYAGLADTIAARISATFIQGDLIAAGARMTAKAIREAAQQ